MKIIVEQTTGNTIRLKNVNPRTHIIVGRVGYNFVIYTKRTHRNELGCLRVFNQSFSDGNGLSPQGSIKECIEGIFGDNYEFHAFENRDWKEALQWLIDNDKNS